MNTNQTALQNVQQAVVENAVVQLTDLEMDLIAGGTAVVNTI